MPAIIEHLLIGYGSESGNARTLARRLGDLPALQAYAPEVRALNDIEPTRLPAGTLLAVISSSFGDGDPPGNAETFLAQVQQAERLDGLNYVIFGLGDTAYPNFCGFTKTLDQALSERGAHASIPRVDADACYEDFFERWTPVLQQVLAGNAQAGQALRLQVTAYGANTAFPASIIERRQLNQSLPGAWHIRLDITGSGMVYRAGDNLYVMPENDPALLQGLADWYGTPEAAEALAGKELRQLGKGLLRELARLSGNEQLKDLLKISQRKELESYLWGADLLDLLQDFCTPQTVPLAALLNCALPACLPRAYSIASAGGDHVDLCIREVIHERNGRTHRGCATNWLLRSDDPIRVFCRANPGFHLPRDTSIPLILVGTGTGIAPLMGLLRDIRTSGKRRDTCLIFGEKCSDKDFLYRQELRAMLDDGTLSDLYTAFSRDGGAKYYVQHAMADQSGYLRNMLAQGAHLYLCGNKRHLEQAVAGAVDSIMEGLPGLGENETGWQLLGRTGRLHRELY
ncbi:sulfite reductase (NADPH) flavoprotein alpha-component [Kerstersia gyiorum]|uniref:Sulfite reductase (NADPH) flavoprotein alpha-component n=1 Tax=Kerstersia gyiorum TaxID=206506 RepID=A0A4Q7N157_9BURK|nr:sulfite reductase flavoprotein subunit alpha [Kerstersia gyiorum]KAB0544797.1 sulfite reductase flavoprotein subunit alpha [Kerstersia gyiorum]RZS73289.1 sulfite reductase (NADPH) flavoprotein alpha-component [Kerstersia gyiorum]